MTTSDKILEFIDGTLDGGDEQVLFEEMAKLPELRTELRHYVQIGDAVRADREAYAPPADVERRLLGGLGLIPLGAAGSGAVAGGTAGMIGLLGMKSGLLPMMLGFLLGGLLVGGGVWLALDDDGEATRVAVADRRSGADGEDRVEGGSDRNGAAGTDGIEQNATGWLSKIDATTRPGSTTPSFASARSVPAPSQPNVIYRDRIGPVPAAPPKESNTTDVNATNAMATSTPTSSITATHTTSSISLVRQSESPLAPTMFAPPALQAVRPADGSIDELKMVAPSATRTFDAPVIEGRSLRVELRKIGPERPFVANNARPVETQFINDFFSEGIIGGAHYAVGPRTTVGLEAGRERFSQSLLYNREDTLIIEQRPSISWLAVAVNHDVRPFGVPLTLGIGIGSSEYRGPLVRGRVGFDVLDLFGARFASSPLSIPLSGEISSLVYTYNDQYMVTGNLGLTAGLSYRFGF